MQGKIIKGIAGFYYVHVPGAGVYECKAKGVFRKEKQKPFVGDYVDIQILSQEEMTGNVAEILPRKNVLVRPAAANIDQALVIFAIARPKPNLNLLDRFLIAMKHQGVESVICFNKQDIADEKERQMLREAYEKCGSRVLFASAYTKEGIGQIRGILQGKTTAVAGPSGVGKSSIINILKPEAGMETGSISKKIDRGRHTTRHSQLIALDEDTYIMDTPGFSSLFLQDLEKEDLKNYFAEFDLYEKECRFQGCVHIHEPDCGVKKALEAGKISRIRYENYVELFQELKEKRRY